MWHLFTSFQMISVLVDKMIRTQITDCAAVANWLFSQDMAHEFTRWDTPTQKHPWLKGWWKAVLTSTQTLSRLYIWEILHSTIRKMDKHVQKIQQELEEAKDKLEKQQHKRVNYGPDLGAVSAEKKWLIKGCLCPCLEGQRGWWGHGQSQWGWGGSAGGADREAAGESGVRPERTEEPLSCHLSGTFLFL